MSSRTKFFGLCPNIFMYQLRNISSGQNTETYCDSNKHV